ncbi:Orotidine 5'-phosphate decarboxylase [Paramyrothecium foliicola]|nr:Orotidine 5'-phosphate decarboxylase [Paramyrothecium foliicola]
MASKSSQSYLSRAMAHPNPVARRLFKIAEAKRSNLIFSADCTDTETLLQYADAVGPFIAVLKTHIDIFADFGEATVAGLKSLAAKHDFLIFEDRKFIDIGKTVQKQSHGGALRISEWADIVNVCILGGSGVVEALDQVIHTPNHHIRKERAVLLLAEMTTVGSTATGAYTEKCIQLAREKSHVVMGFVATKAMHVEDADDDFVVFTTGINRSDAGDSLGQQYQTPCAAIAGGTDFIIVGRGIYDSPDLVNAAKQYQIEAWDAYEARMV